MKKLIRSPTKERELNDKLDMAQILVSTLYDSHVFSFEFNKGLEGSKSPMETIYHLLI